MADFATLTNAFATVTGATSKAAILIADKRQKAEMVPIPNPAVKPGGAGAGGLNVPSGGALNKLKKAGAAVKGAVTAAADYIDDTAVVTNVKNNLGYNLSNIVGMDKEFQKAFRVQFNPSSLNISGYSGGSQDIIDYTETGKAAKATPLETNYAFSVNLIFDQMELQNCFPWDIMDFTLTTGMQAAMKAVSVATTGLDISVQAVTEGMIGALYNPRTRYVGFLWGPLLYKGVIKSVNARYTMFDLMGRPVRSQISLTLYLADKDIKQAGAKSNLGMWANAYKKAFLDTASAGQKAIKIAQEASKAVLGT